MPVLLRSRSVIFNVPYFEAKRLSVSKTISLGVMCVNACGPMTWIQFWNITRFNSWHLVWNKYTMTRSFEYKAFVSIASPRKLITFTHFDLVRVAWGRKVEVSECSLFDWLIRVCWIWFSVFEVWLAIAYACINSIHASALEVKLF